MGKPSIREEDPTVGVAYTRDAAPHRWRQQLQRVRMRTKIVVPMAVLAVLPALIVGLFAISQTRESLRRIAVQRVEFDARSQAAAIEQFLQITVQDLRFLAQMNSVRQLADAAANGLGSLEPLREAAAQDLLLFCQSKRAYYQVRYLDGTGQEIVRLNVSDGRPQVVPRERLQNKGHRYYVQEAMALNPGEVYVSQMDLNVEYGRIERPIRGVVRYASSVLGESGQQRGLVVINTYADYILSLIGPHPSGIEVWLVGQDGSYLGYVGNNGARAERFELNQNRKLSADFEPEVVSAILGERDAGSVLETAGRWFSFAPINVVGDPGERQWVLLTAYSQVPLDAPVRQLTIFLSVLLALVVTVAGFLGVFVGSYLARPVSRLRAATREIAGGDLTRHVDVTTGDELEGLAKDFNAMTDQLRGAQERLSRWNEELEHEVAHQTERLHQLQTSLARADKMASIGQITAGVMHEVGNPLAAIKTKIQVAQEEDALGADCRSLLDEILEEVNRLAQFLRTFSKTGRRSEPQMTEVVLDDVVQSVSALVGPELRQRVLQLAVSERSERAVIRGDAEQLRQLLINLILNAADASSSGAEIIIRVGVTEARSGAPGADDIATIEVVDHGEGIPEEHMDKIWDPFFTTRSDGTGLGLAICRQIIVDHGGTVEVRTIPGSGTSIFIAFPCVRRAGQPSHQPDAGIDRG